MAAVPVVIKNADVQETADGETRATITLTIQPDGNWTVNGKARRGVAAAMAELADAVAYLDEHHRPKAPKAVKADEAKDGEKAAA